MKLIFAEIFSYNCAYYTSLHAGVLPARCVPVLLDSLRSSVYRWDSRGGPGREEAFIQPFILTIDQLNVGGGAVLPPSL